MYVKSLGSRRYSDISHLEKKKIIDSKVTWEDKYVGSQINHNLTHRIHVVCLPTFA